MKDKIVAGVGIVLLILGAGALLLVCRDLVLSLRFGGPSGGYIGAHSFGAMLVDGAMMIVFLLIGGLLTRRHLQRRTPRIIVGVVAIIMILLGLNAGYVS